MKSPFPEGKGTQTSRFRKKKNSSPDPEFNAFV